ncbi:hypothetical protein C4D60_Mb01t33120 [Musa balbisiana]|uniref:Uncharacterized protein n=1 Tax=Musa balbisiana TaxID=52838 RepID=A0A4S8JSI0_MUSBA|nr:hypothetical protein C4D60_Mb01t33120 [Musa balbisiana]
MLRLRAFRQTNGKIVKIQLHPTYPWLVTADNSDHVSVWNWEHRQVIYELKAGGVDERRLVGTKLEKLAEGETVIPVKLEVSLLKFSSAVATSTTIICCVPDMPSLPMPIEFRGKPTEAIRGGRLRNNFRSCNQVYDVTDGTCFRHTGISKNGLCRLPTFISKDYKVCLQQPAERKYDSVHNENIRECMEFLSRSATGDGPLVAFGGSDGVIRVLSMITWKLVRRYTGGHKGSITCLMTFISSSGEVFLVSGASDGLLIIWSADHVHDSRELVPKLSLKAHDGGVVAVELSRVMGSAPQLITIGADKTLVIWDSISFRELRRIKPVPKLACHSVASWCHPRAPNLDILTCVKDSHIWAIEHPTYSALTRPLCELSSLIPPQVLASNKKLRVIGLHGGALLGVAYRTSRRISPMAATAYSTQSMPLSGFGNSGVMSSFGAADDPFSSKKPAVGAAPQNFQLYSWETYQPVSGLLSQPEWTAWDRTVEYCAFAYHQYIVISSLRPQFRYLGDVAIPFATCAVWHRRQLFVATPTTIECVFVDAGVAPIDLETKRKKEEMKAQEAQSRAFAEHGELALIAVDSPQVATSDRISLRPPTLQVVRLASFQDAPSIPPFITLPKQHKVDGEDTVLPKEMEEKKLTEVAVAGGGVSVAATRFPPEQKRPIGPLVVVGVRDGVLWLIDRYMCAHALSLSHPGIRCRCLAAYGDAVSAVKWATRLSREHHDDLAQFMLGMGYATEALHLPGISKRLEFELAMQSNDLKRALQCLLTMSNSRDVGQETTAADITEILSLTAVKQENLVDAVQGIAKFAKEFLDLIDAADATGQADIAREALKRLASAGSVKGALQGQVLRGLALRLANHGELTRLSVRNTVPYRCFDLCSVPVRYGIPSGTSKCTERYTQGLINNLIVAGHGQEAAFSAAVLGDNALMEKAWLDTGMLAEAVLHAHAHGRPTMRNLVQAWNKMLQKELDHTPVVKTDAAAAFFASLKEPKFTSLAEAGKKPPIEILPPGMASLSAPPITIGKKSAATTTTSATALQGPSAAAQTTPPAPIQSDPTTMPDTSNSQTDKPLMLEAPPPVDQSDGTRDKPLMLEGPPPVDKSDGTPPIAEQVDESDGTPSIAEQVDESNGTVPIAEQVNESDGTPPVIESVTSPISSPEIIESPLPPTEAVSHTPSAQNPQVDADGTVG